MSSNSKEELLIIGSKNNAKIYTHHDTSSASSTTSSSSSSLSSSTSSSPSSSSGDTSSSSELDPSDALQSPLTGLLNFEGFSMPQMSKFTIGNIDMPNFGSLTTKRLRSLNINTFQQRLPNLANNISMNLTNLQNFTTSMPNFPNLSYLSQLRTASTAAELQNLFTSFSLAAALPHLPPFPQLPQLPPFPQLPQLPQLPQFPPIFSRHFAARQLLTPRSQLTNSVRNMHRRLNDIAQRLPNLFHFHRWTKSDGTNQVRIYFLLDDFIYYCDQSLANLKDMRRSGESKRKAKRHSQRDVNAVSNPSPSPSTSSGHSSCNGESTSSTYNVLGSPDVKSLHPQPLLDPKFGPIQHYECTNSNTTVRFVFLKHNCLHYFDDSPGTYSNPQIGSVNREPKCDFQICPNNPDLVAYVCQGDLWCVNIRTSQEIRLTYSYSTNESSYSTSNAGVTSDKSLVSNDLNSEPILIGRPSHIIREEFGRHRGFWWQPKLETDHRCDQNEQKILFEETDQSQVELVAIPSFGGRVEYQRFPRAGKSNATSRLRLITIRLSSDGTKLIDASLSEICPVLKDLYSEFEYLPRVGWLNDDVIWFQMLNRRQTHLVIAIVSLCGHFQPQLIYEEHNDMYWVRTHDTLHFLNTNRFGEPLKQGSELAFIWSSEESGFRHLYFIKVRLGDNQASPRMMLKKQLTEGNWEVDEKRIWVDENNKLIYFCGSRETPLETHLYVLSYRIDLDNLFAKTKVHRLTEFNYCQSSIAFNENCSIYVNIQSNISVPPFGFINIIQDHAKGNHERSTHLPDGKQVALILVNSFLYPENEAIDLEQLTTPLSPRKPIVHECQLDLLPGLGRPELFGCRLTSGELVYGSLFKPEFMESGVKYPTVLEIYGGPDIQLVTNNFTNLRQPTRHLLSAAGYVVVLIDGRGSSGRGISFGAHAHHRVGQVEIADQVEVLQWLAKTTDFIDLTRVAVKGWSYGGFLSLMALAQYPEIFKIAIAGAPVTDWTMYDSAYTERYLGFPDETPEVYHKGSLLSYVRDLPDESNRLLLLHGLMDENVHFSHTSNLVQALIEADKPYDLQIFPIEQHALKSSSARENQVTNILSYLQLNL